MKVRWLSGDDLRSALSIADAVDAVEAAYRAVSEGAVRVPVRVQLPAGEGVSLFMPATDAGLGRTALKLVSVYPGNAARGLPVIMGLAVLVDAGTGRPLAVMDAATLTALRTGAASGVAARHLAARGASVMAMLGAGAQAPVTVLAVCRERPIREVRVWSRTRARAEALRARLDPELPGVALRAVDAADEAVDGADVICTATPTREPLFDAGRVKPGALVSAVGSFQRGMRELPRELLGRARLFVDQREAALEEAGELIDAVESGLRSPKDLVEIGEVIAGRHPGRRGQDEVVVFKSVGLAAQDLYAAARAVAGAQAAGIGSDLSL